MNYIYAGAELKVIAAIDFTVSEEDPHQIGYLNSFSESKSELEDEN